MEKINDIQQKKVADDELEQVGGGRRLWKAVTAEYTECWDKPRAMNLPMKDGEENELLGARTLEMRVRKKRRQEDDDAPQVIKL